MTTQYIDRTTDEEYELWHRDLCGYCSTDHKTGCLARHCTSCSSDWLATTGNDSDDGRPKRETCPDCIADGFGTLDETINWLRKEGDRIALETSARYSAKFDTAAAEVIAELDKQLERRRSQSPPPVIERRSAA